MIPTDDARTVYEFGPFRLDTGEQRLLRDGQPVPLFHKAYETLLVLIEHECQTVSKQQLFDRVWPETFVGEATLAQNISTIRRALGKGDEGRQYIETIPRRGYRFAARVQRKEHIESPELIRPATTEFPGPVGAPREDGDLLKHSRSVAWIVAALLVAVVAGAALWFSSREKALEASDRPPDGTVVEPVAVEAREAYLKGQYFWNQRNRDGLFKSIGYFQQAIAHDPFFARAHAGLALAYAFDLNHMREAEPLARKALALDPMLADAYACIGFVRMFHDWNWKDAERALRRAVELDPKYATAQQWYALWLATQGRLKDAETHMRLARDLEPLSLSINADLGQILYLRRNYDGAIQQLQRTLDLDQDFFSARASLHDTYALAGRYQDAIKEFGIIEQMRGHKTLDLPEVTFARHGMEFFWRSLAQELARLPESKVRAREIAVYFLLAGNRQEALRWLEKAVARKADFDMVFLGVNPAFDRLRGDPQFDSLLRQMGLP